MPWVITLINFDQIKRKNQEVEISNSEWVNIHLLGVFSFFSSRLLIKMLFSQEKYPEVRKILDILIGKI